MDSAPVFRPTRSRYFVLTADYLLPFLIIIGVCSLVWLTIYSQFFHITTITCVLDYEPCTDPTLLSEFDKLKGQNIFRFDPTNLQKRLTSGDFTIREAKITRELPASVTVALQSVYPVVALQVANQSNWIVLDNKLRVIGTHTIDPNVPTVIVTTPLTLTIGKTPTDSTLIQTLQLAKNLSSELMNVKSLTLVDEDTITLILSGGIQAIFTPKKDEMTQVRVLQAVLGDATIQQGIHIIDVRFARPVLR